MTVSIKLSDNSIKKTVLPKSIRLLCDQGMVVKMIVIQNFPPRQYLQSSKMEYFGRFSIHLQAKRRTQGRVEDVQRILTDRKL